MVLVVLPENVPERPLDDAYEMRVKLLGSAPLLPLERVDERPVRLRERQFSRATRPKRRSG